MFKRKKREVVEQATAAPGEYRNYCGHWIYDSKGRAHGCKLRVGHYGLHKK